MYLEENILPRNISGIAKLMEIYGFVIVNYYVRSESEHIIALWDQDYDVPGLPNYLLIIYPQGVYKSVV